jgi:UDP-N-acetylglucosamine--N-acetylmuramyl-(pentapeptide) pyrophosphoryl-undecaprenol N-acetylglucosamine transferase
MSNPSPTSRRLPRSVVISAGGTGGHIFPGIALGQALQRLAPEVPVHYFCGDRPLEQRLYSTEGIQPEVIRSSALTGNILQKFVALARLGWNTVRTLFLLRRLRAGVVVGFGGYTTGPAMAAAVVLRLKTVLHEANAVPGKANRLMGPYASLVTGHFPSSVKSIRNRNTAVVGMPLRARPNPPNRAEAFEILGLDPGRQTLLVTGGSQGARALNLRTLNALRQLDILSNRDFQILWATGQNHHSEIESQLSADPPQYLRIVAVPFIERMDCAMRVAGAAVARAGASTVAELLTAGVFPFLVPFPFAVHNHQVLNGRAVVEAHCGWMVEEKDLTDEVMTDHLRRLMAKIRDLPPGARKAPPGSLDSSQSADQLARLVLAQMGHTVVSATA